MHIQSFLGNNHLLPLSHMAKSYIWLEETNQLMNELSIGYMMNPDLSLCDAKNLGEEAFVALNIMLWVKAINVLYWFYIKPIRKDQAKVSCLPISPWCLQQKILSKK